MTEIQKRRAAALAKREKAKDEQSNPSAHVSSSDSTFGDAIFALIVMISLPIPLMYGSNIYFDNIFMKIISPVLAHASLSLLFFMRPGKTNDLTISFKITILILITQVVINLNELRG